jgi:hypothetical protein
LRGEILFDDDMGGFNLSGLSGACAADFGFKDGFSDSNLLIGGATALRAMIVRGFPVFKRCVGVPNVLPGLVNLASATSLRTLVIKPLTVSVFVLEPLVSRISADALKPPRGDALDFIHDCGNFSTMRVSFLMAAFFTAANLSFKTSSASALSTSDFASHFLYIL